VRVVPNLTLAEPKKMQRKKTTKSARWESNQKPLA